MAVVFSAKASGGYEVKTFDVLRKDLSEDATSIEHAISNEGKKFLRKIHWPVLVDFSGLDRKLKLTNLNGMGVVRVNAVKELDLSHNSLTTTLGLEIFKELQMLLASHNRFKSVALMNCKLEVLDLSNNELARFPDISALERLKDLKIANNFITSIPALKAGNLPNLSSIDLSNNVIGWTTEEFGQQLQNNLGYIWRLTSLSFMDNPFLQNIEEYHRLVQEFLPRLKRLDFQPIDQYSTMPMWQRIRIATKLMPNSPKKAKDDENDTLWDKVMKMRKKEMTDEEKIAALIKKWQSPDPGSPSSTRSSSPRGATLKKGSKWEDLRKQRRTTTPDGLRGAGMGKFAERLMIRRSSSSSIVTEKKTAEGAEALAAGSSNVTQEGSTKEDEKRRKLVEKLMRRKESAVEFTYEPKDDAEKHSAFLKRVLARRSSEPSPAASSVADQASEAKMRKKFIRRIKLRRKSSEGNAEPDADGSRWARKRKQSNATLTFAILRHDDRTAKAVDATEALKSVDDASSIAATTPPGSPFVGSQPSMPGSMVEPMQRRPSTKVVSPQLVDSEVHEEDLPELALSVKEVPPRKPSLAAAATAIKAASSVRSLVNSFKAATELGEGSADNGERGGEKAVNSGGSDRPGDGGSDK